MLAAPPALRQAFSMPSYIMTRYTLWLRHSSAVARVTDIMQNGMLTAVLSRAFGLLAGSGLLVSERPKAAV